MSLIEIILRAKPYIYQSSFINALWVEGSYATGRFDEASDIDVWLDIFPGKQQESLLDFQNAILKVVELRDVTNVNYYSEDPKLAKVKIYINGMSDNNRIELDMQESSRGFVFDRQENDILTLFDKIGVINYGD